ncbi:hypothetical protein EJD97_025683, partial [Solanum chilense]
MEQGPSRQSHNVGASNTNANRVYDSDDEMWAENISKRLHDPLAMKNKKVVEPKKKLEKIPKKGRRKVTHVVSRSTLPKNACSNIVPTPDEEEALDLLDSQEANRTELSTTPIVAKKSSRVSDTSSPPQPKRRKNLDTHKTKGSKPLSEQLRPPLNQSFPMPAEEPTPPANVSSVHVSSQVPKYKYVYPDIEELKQHMKETNREDGQQPKDSTPSDSVSPDTRETMNTLIADLGCLPIHANQQELIDNQSFLSNSQLPIDIPITDIVVQSDINTPHARIPMPSNNCESPYLTSFGSSEKEKAVVTDVIRLNFPFEGYEITNQAPSYLIDEFIEWVTTCLLKAHSKKKPSEDKYKARVSSLGFEMMNYVVAFSSNKNWFYAMSQPKNCWTDQHIDVIFYYLRKKLKLRSMDQYRYTTVNCLFNAHINNTHDRYYNNEADDDISTQEHFDHARVVSVHERSTINVMKGFSIPVGLLWHLVDDVYILINYDGNFHWVLVVVELNHRLIRVYDSSLGTRKRVYSEEIHTLLTVVSLKTLSGQTGQYLMHTRTNKR